MSFASGIVGDTARLHMRLYQANLERNQLILRVALNERMAKEMAKLDDKYDGTEANALQEEINRRSIQKETIAKQHGNVTQALKWIEDLKITALSLKDAATTGSADAWDNALKDLRSYAGSRVMDPDNLIGNSGQGVWSVDTEIVGGFGLDATVRSSYLGADYVIELDDGTVLKPDFEGNLSGGGLSFASSALSITGRAGANNDVVTFSDGTNTYTGTIKTPRGYSITLDSGERLVANTDTGRLSGGGLDFAMSSLTLTQRDPADSSAISFSDGVTTYQGDIDFDGPPMTEAWLYNGFATQADKDRAAADATMMLRYIEQVEREQQMSLDALDGLVLKFNAAMSELTDEWSQVMDEELDAKSAERKAIMTRVALTEQAFAISGTQGAYLIEGMFHGSSGWPEKQSVFQIVNPRSDTF